MTVRKAPSSRIHRRSPLAITGGGGSESLRPRLSAAANAVFETGQLFDANRAACMQPAGGDADFSAEAELAAIGKLR
jgi:hypothetical protein